ncbi:hypothetical protein [Paenibacillus sp. URB8-2]|uniref:hypothetical protein n=1 Tax=Paenibacillus sp. URB8-2 TaxID=2741301 RepID=UPI0015C23A51|nr:hypothetical protein [Paenibacillus sp. URB8-2]BCG57237.1 hypothetical protein PUR_06620 [Paenibacillus sp. URB8-2]
MNEKEDLERRLSEMLTGGELEQNEREARQLRQISPKYEIRIQTSLDPIVEETYRYREMARDLDDRYDKYLERTLKKQRDVVPPESAADRKEAPGGGERKDRSTGGEQIGD